jgi:hypothetical protein
MNPSPIAIKEQEAWNEAYDRLSNFLNTFALGDHAYVSKLALDFLSEAQRLHRENPSPEPIIQTMTYAQKQLAAWLQANLDEKDQSSSRVLANGYIALLLSQLYRNSPASFLATPLPDDVRQSMRQILLVAGPDLNISSMTPRHLDYGPMLHFARQTWHRFDARELFIALVFWSGVYTVFYWWLSQLL